MGVEDCNSFLGADRGRELENCRCFLSVDGSGEVEDCTRSFFIGTVEGSKVVCDNVRVCVCGYDNVRVCVSVIM